jgi:vanillate monooxygenase ferredoxin subunit
MAKEEPCMVELAARTTSAHRQETTLSESAMAQAMSSPAASPAAQQRLAVTVTARAAIAEGVLRVDLRAAEGGAALPPFSAGAHVDVFLPAGLTRSYSLCNSPHERGRYELGILLEPAGRGGSRSAHADLHPGRTIEISMPRNHFGLVPAPHSLLIAGGIGITPLLSMAEQLARSEASFELHHCTRSLARTPYRDRIGSSAYASRAWLHLDDDPAAQRFDAAQTLANATPGSHLYVCGPQGFMDHVLGAARALDWSDERIHREYFGAAPLTAAASDGSFRVRLARSGRVVEVGAAQTVVQALAVQGIAVPVSCEQGICGTCVLRVLDGVPDHRDLWFSDTEHAANDRFTPCCSRARCAELTIDL